MDRSHHCADVPVWRHACVEISPHRHIGTSPCPFCTNKLVTIRIQHRNISTQAHLHMDRSQQCGDVPVWRCGDMPVWRYLHTSTSAPLLDLFALMHYLYADIFTQAHLHIDSSQHCGDVHVWRHACVEISPQRHIGTSP